MKKTLENYYPQVATGAIVIKNGRVLLVKRKNPPSQYLWAIPGGRVKAGESLVNSVKRELLEETGVIVDVGEVVHVFDVIETHGNGNTKTHYVIIDYRAEYVSGELRAGDDALEVRWVSKNEIDSLPINKTSRNLLRDKFGFI